VLRVSAPQPPASKRDDEKEVVRALADLITLVEPRLLQLWKSTGMTFAQRRLLRRLRTGPRSAGALAAELGVAAPTVTRQLQKLEERGLIGRAVDTKDRRRVVVTLTIDGEKSLADNRVIGGSPLALAARDLPPKRRRNLVESLAELTSLARERGASTSDD